MTFCDGPCNSTTHNLNVHWQNMLYFGAIIYNPTKAFDILVLQMSYNFADLDILEPFTQYIIGYLTVSNINSVNDYKFEKTER